MVFSRSAHSSETSSSVMTSGSTRPISDSTFSFLVVVAQVELQQRVGRVVPRRGIERSVSRTDPGTGTLPEVLAREKRPKPAASAPTLMRSVTKSGSDAAMIRRAR